MIMACTLTQLPPRRLTDSLLGLTRWCDQGCGMPPVGMVSDITWAQPCSLALSAAAVKLVPRSAIGWFSKLYQDQQSLEMVTRVHQESSSPETSILRRQVQGQAGKFSQLVMVRHR